MTQLEQQLETDLKEAMRSRAPEVGVLRLLLAALKNEQIARGPKVELKELDVLAVLRRELKKRQEAAKLYEQGGRLELAQAETHEAEVVSRYLPPPPSREEVLRIAHELQISLGLSGSKAMGQLTKAVLEHFAGAAQGQVVSQVVKEVLG